MSSADCDTSLAKVGAGDTATAETVLPLSPDELHDFLRDVPRLVRLNPQLAISRWVPAEWGFRYAGHNESNGRDFDLGVVVDAAPGDAALNLRYDAGLKQMTCIAIEPASHGARLVFTEHYPRIENPDDPRVAEVDKSLVPWVTAIRSHVLAHRRWGWLPGWLWWTERFMLAMPPRQRRIVRLLIWTTALEFAVFLGVVVVLRFAT